MIGGSGGGGISFPSKGAGKTFEVLWAFQLPLEAVIIGLGSALDNLGWRVVDKERKWTDGQEGKDRILAHVISYLGVRPCPHLLTFVSLLLHQTPITPPSTNRFLLRCRSMCGKSDLVLMKKDLFIFILGTIVPFHFGWTLRFYS